MEIKEEEDLLLELPQLSRLFTIDPSKVQKPQSDPFEELPEIPLKRRFSTVLQKPQEEVKIEDLYNLLMNKLSPFISLYVT